MNRGRQYRRNDGRHHKSGSRRHGAFGLRTQAPGIVETVAGSASRATGHEMPWSCAPSGWRWAGRPSSMAGDPQDCGPP